MPYLKWLGGVALFAILVLYLSAMLVLRLATTVNAALHRPGE